MGVKVEEGKSEELASKVIESSDHTLLYPDPQLQKRLIQAYPNIVTRKDVTIISVDDLAEWYTALLMLLTEKGIEHPV